MKNTTYASKHKRIISSSLLKMTLGLFALIGTTQTFGQYFEKITTGSLVEIKQQSYSANWADVNNDGYDDMLILNLSDTGTNVLYMNNGDGSFSANPESGIEEFISQSIAATWGDYNNDGYLDVYICNTANQGAASENFLFKNNGDGSFTRIIDGVVATDVGWSVGAAWADYNRDGFIDLYVANFDGVNYLYKNLGDGTFERITEGDIVTDVAASYGAYWADYDNDNWPDLFVANAYGSALPPDNNALYHNNGDGTFTKITEGHIVNNDGISQGASWGDYNNDGYLDLFVSNHDWSDNKINFLYKNNGDGTFSLVSNINVTTDQNTSFGSAWLDANNDGFLDLVVANNKSTNRNNFFYLNNGDQTFSSINTDPFATDVLRSFGISFSDYNRDGYADIFSATYSTSQENGFYKNIGGTNNWIAIKLQGTVSNNAAIGARINVWTNGILQIREIASSSGAYCSSSFTQNIGIGSNEIIDSIIVTWPSGSINKWTDVGINQHLTLTESSSLNNETSIISFQVENQAEPTVIDPESSTVLVKMPYGYSLEALQPVISVSEGAQVSPASGQAIDFSQGSVTYTVTAENGSDIQNWEVTVQNLLNSESEIISFVINGQIGETVINTDNKTINLVMAVGTDLSALVPTITVSEGASVNPSSGSVVDFSGGDVSFTVTSEDNQSTTVWVVSISLNVSIEEIVETKNIWVFPNPTSGILNIVDDSEKIISVEIISLSGSIISEKSYDSNAIQMDLTSLKPGIYFVKIIAGNTTKTFKFLKN